MRTGSDKVTDSPFLRVLCVGRFLEPIVRRLLWKGSFLGALHEEVPRDGDQPDRLHCGEEARALGGYQRSCPRVHRQALAVKPFVFHLTGRGIVAHMCKAD